MAYGIISADCHMDLMFVPHDTFTARAPAGWRDRMPRIVESDDGFAWVAGERGELRLGPWASQGSRVWSGVRGQHMREAGYAPEDRRPATPELRLADLERDRVDRRVRSDPLQQVARMCDLPVPSLLSSLRRSLQRVLKCRLAHALQIQRFSVTRPG